MVSAVLMISNRFRIPGSIAGATMAAVATSAPELGTNVFSLLAARNPDSAEATASIGAGTIFGSAVFNLAAVIGLVGLLYGAKLARRVVARDSLVYAGALVLLLVLILFGGASPREITRWEGWVLVAAYAAYLVWLARDARVARERERDDGSGPEDTPIGRASVKLVGCVVAVTVACYFLVEATRFLARAGGRALEMDENGLISVLSLVVVAAATSVPDLFASLSAARRGEGSLAVSNAIGSNTFDLLICIGLPFGVIGGQRIVGDVALSGGFLLFTAVVLTGLIRPGWSVTRLKGAILLALYLLFVGLVVMRTFLGGP
jgi:cation:H+ antiporter